MNAITAQRGISMETDKLLQEAIENIARNHRQIIDDWCKAYMAQIYQETGSIKPGDFTLNEQDYFRDGIGKRYWFTPGIPDYSERINMKENESQITFNADVGENTWIMKLTNKGIFFNRERYPNSSPDDFADAVISVLEKKFTVKFERKDPPYDKD